MNRFRIVEWGKYQHYKNRNPPWIKLHREILTSRMWVGSSDETRVLALSCMLLAAASDNSIPMDPAYMKRVAYLNKPPNLKPLIDIGFIEIIDNNDTCKQMLADARPEKEKEKEESRGETPIVPVNGDGVVERFETFWKAYPRKVGKGEARKSWVRLKPGADLLAKMLIAIDDARRSPGWLPDKTGKAYIPNPATWLNQERWDDQPNVLVVQNGKVMPDKPVFYG